MTKSVSCNKVQEIIHSLSSATRQCILFVASLSNTCNNAEKKSAKYRIFPAKNLQKEVHIATYTKNKFNIKNVKKHVATENYDKNLSTRLKEFFSILVKNKSY